jgi:hypothetical protein
MPRDLRDHAIGTRARRSRLTHAALSNDSLLDLAPEEREQLGLPPDAPLRLDRTRKPANGDLVWVEVVRFGSTQRLARFYSLNDGWVTLTVPDGQTPAVMRRQGEILVLGVVVEESGAS